jgi:HEAT repeat protein
VGKILLKATSGPDVRRYAARVLGGRKAADQLKALGRVLLLETESNALLEVLAALGEINDPLAGDALLKFLRKRRDYLAKRTQGDVLSHSDWETIAPTLARACSLVGTYKPAKGAAVIAAEILDGVFLSGVGVRYDVQNQRPLPYARALSEAACGALVKLGGEDARAALQRMRKAGEGASGTSSKSIHRLVAIMGDWARDPAIAGHVAEALSHLDG